MSAVRYGLTDSRATLTPRGNRLVITGASPDTILVEWRPEPNPLCVLLHLGSGWATVVDNPHIQAALDQAVKAADEARAAYRPASELVGPEGVRSYKTLLAVLRRHPEIRRFGRGRRLWVHLGDWQAFQKRKDAEAFDRLDEDPRPGDEVTDGFIAECLARRDEIRRRKKERRPR
jgi:hypothetical protein